ncbi:MAG: hypothetical protein F6J97_01830 [Leptolyngbya sp. SIO4C1]|nr:hypothetical protein [Leptolyngbya sp. SIO4C1]
MPVPNASLSLYSAFLDAMPMPAGYQTTPRGFKRIVQLTVDFLIAQQLSVTLWVKLPKDAAWWDDLSRYLRSHSAAQLYCIGSTGLTQTDQAQLVATIPPLPDLKGEYLLLIVADEFVCTLLARREMAANERRDLTLYSSLTLKVAQSLMRRLQQIVEANPRSDRLSLAQAPLAALPQSLSDSLTDAFLSWQFHAQPQAADEAELPADAVELAAPLADPMRRLIQNAEQELRTPLTTIKTALTLLNSQTLKPSQRQRYLEMISSECERQSALINSVFELLQLQNQTYAAVPLQLADIVPGMVSTYQPLARERNVMLAYTIPNNLPPISGIEPYLKQSLISLLNNSIQFTSEGGQVWVTAEQHSAAQVALKIKDTGLGITEAELPLVFEAFYRGSAAATQGVRGSGLGLTLAKQLLHQFGGALTVSSLADGTLLTALLPIWQD